MNEVSSPVVDWQQKYIELLKAYDELNYRYTIVKADLDKLLKAIGAK